MAPMTGVVSTEWKVDLASAKLIDVSNKSLLVIGGTAGLGLAIAEEAVKAGYGKVTVVGRSRKPGTSEKIEFVQADLSSMETSKRIGETVAPANIVVLTNGIVAKKEREVTAEGLEMDMAVSYLSRLVLLRYLVPRLPAESRVFNMGFPGSNQAENFHLEDLNSEKEYEGLFGWVHLNTVAGNEALVLHSAASAGDSSTVSYFGLNPGFIATGIRSNMYESGIFKFLGPVMETVMSWFAHSPESYAQSVVPLLTAPDLEKHSGASFNPSAQPTLPSTMFTKDPELAAKIIDKSEALIREKTGIAVPK